MGGKKLKEENRRLVCMNEKLKRDVDAIYSMAQASQNELIRYKAATPLSQPKAFEVLHQTSCSEPAIGFGTMFVCTAMICGTLIVLFS